MIGALSYRKPLSTLTTNDGKGLGAKSMSRFLGDIRQLGYVVPDIEAAMRHWTAVMGVGPFFYADRVPMEDFFFDGAHYETHNSVALANSGPMQIELIQPRDDVPSMYRDFLQAGFSGLQHVAFWTKQFDAQLAAMQERGLTVKMGGKVGENGRFVYFAEEAHPGTVIELSEISGPKGRLFDAIRRAAETWTGEEPVRSFPDLLEV